MRALLYLSDKWYRTAYVTSMQLPFGVTYLSSAVQCGLQTVIGLPKGLVGVGGFEGGT